VCSQLRWILCGPSSQHQLRGTYLKVLSTTPQPNRSPTTNRASACIEIAPEMKHFRTFANAPQWSSLATVATQGQRPMARHHFLLTSRFSFPSGNVPSFDGRQSKLSLWLFTGGYYMWLTSDQSDCFQSWHRFGG
jgi:hypothetical protein